MSWIKLKSESKLVGAFSGAPDVRPIPRVVPSPDASTKPVSKPTPDHHSWPPPEITLDRPFKVVVNESRIYALRASRTTAMAFTVVPIAALIWPALPAYFELNTDLLVVFPAITSFLVWLIGLSLAGEIQKSTSRLKRWKITTAQVTKFRPGDSETAPEIVLQFYDYKGASRMYTRMVRSSEKVPIPVGTFMSVLYDPQESWEAISLYEVLRYVHIEYTNAK